MVAASPAVVVSTAEPFEAPPARQLLAYLLLLLWFRLLWMLLLLLVWLLLSLLLMRTGS
jgi:hypothetical protein